MDASTQVNPELSQIQNRLLNLTNQIEHIHTNIDRLTADMQNSGIQLDALARNLTSPDGNQQVTEHWSQMFERLEEYHDKMDDLLALTKQSAGSQQLNELAQALSQTNENVARNQEQLDELAKSLKKLTRTQFKANTLGENKDQHLNTAFSTLQDMATRRESVDEDQILQNRVQMDQARKEGRTELVAEMLPAMDSLERALESGASLSERQKQEIEKYLSNAPLEVPTHSPAPIATTYKKSGWSRLVSALAGVEEQTQYQLPSFSDTVSVVESEALATQAQNHADNLSQVAASSDAWLDGLNLVRERFLSVLATENVEPIPAMGEQFDPQLHVAVSTQEREDVSNNTIIGVTRSGYYQDGRVLRYAEVSVARNSQSEPAVLLTSDEDADEDSDEESNIIAGAALGTAAAVVGAELLDDEAELESEIQIEPESEAELELEEISESGADVEDIAIDELILDLAPPAEIVADLPDAAAETEAVELIEDEVVLAPSQLPGYVPAVSETYVDEYADVRKAILGHMLGQPAVADDVGADDPSSIAIEAASEGVEVVSSDDPAPSSTLLSATGASTASAASSIIFETDEQVSMNRETDHETFITSEPSERQNISNIEATTSYPNKTNIQSEISWVQYESPKRGSWLSRLFGNS